MARYVSSSFRLFKSFRISLRVYLGDWLNCDYDGQHSSETERGWMDRPTDDDYDDDDVSDDRFIEI